MLFRSGHVAGTEVEAQGGFEGRQVRQGLGLGYTGATAGAAEHDRLHEAGNRELGAQGGGAPDEVGRLQVGTDGRADGAFRMPANYAAETCMVVWIFPEQGEGMQMARPFMVP